MEMELTFCELIWIDDSCTIFGLDHAKTGKLELGDSGSESLRNRGSSAAILGASKNFILKIGSALLRLTEEKKDAVEVDFEEKEIWLLRELAQSSVSIGKEQVGLNLKLKVHEALRDFAAQEILEDMGFKESEEHDIEESKLQDKIVQWQEKDNA